MCHIAFIAVTWSCNKATEKKNALLLADREAPIGWMYLRIFEDSTFEFESRGLGRDADIYSGKVEISHDTLHFHYADSVPAAGQTAIFDSAHVSYMDGKYPERLVISLNKITK